MLSNARPLPLWPAEQTAAMRQHLDKPRLMGRSIPGFRAFVAPHLGKVSDTPGHDEAGSYAHNQHQFNYRLCESAGTLFQITGEER
jgi:hypothetical protein